jgi:KEOPS complex subunit Cgi121
MMRIKKYNRFAIILGFKEVIIDNIDTFLKNIRIGMAPSLIQIFNADHIAGKKHLFFATINALKAFEQGRNISDDLEMETLLYASGHRQIDKAIELIGYMPASPQLAILMITSSQKEAEEAENKIDKFIPGIRDNSVLEIQKESKAAELHKIFKISKLELETMVENNSDRKKTLMWLIIEHNSILFK